MVPLKYGLSWLFGKLAVLVNIYNGDGTVAISHGGIEMGQGINTKAMQVCAYKLGIPITKIVTMPTETVSSPNGFASSASITSEFVCFGVLMCCEQLMERIKPVKDQMPAAATWEQVIEKCFLDGIDLSAKSWANIGERQKTDKQYSVYGAACADVELDVLTGCRRINRVDLLYDCGESMNPDIDVGQIEGAFTMGVGYNFMERILFDKDTGRNLTDSVWEYHVPTPWDIPLDFRVELLPNVSNPDGILGSKGVGEPAIVMACSVLFALKHAIEAARLESNIDEYFQLDIPTTVDVAYPLCMNNISQFKLH